jgi:8-oxo-dGTP diphosphatase
MPENFKKGVDYVGVCVVYFCHDGNGRFVMAHRNNNTRDEHETWDIGGGGLELGDTVEGTLRKEISEEYRTDVLDYEFLGYRDVHRMHDGKPTHWIALDFKVRVDPEKVKNGESHKFDEVRWFTFKTMPEKVHSQIPEFLRLYRKKLMSF